MKKLLRLTSIILIQAFLLTDFVWSGGEFLLASQTGLHGYLSPKLQINTELFRKNLQDYIAQKKSEENKDKKHVPSKSANKHNRFPRSYHDLKKIIEFVIPQNNNNGERDRRTGIAAKIILFNWIIDLILTFIVMPWWYFEFLGGTNIEIGNLLTANVKLSLLVPYIAVSLITWFERLCLPFIFNILEPNIVKLTFKGMLLSIFPYLGNFSALYFIRNWQNAVKVRDLLSIVEILKVKKVFEKKIAKYRHVFSREELEAIDRSLAQTAIAVWDFKKGLPGFNSLKFEIRRAADYNENRALRAITRDSFRRKSLLLFFGIPEELAVIGDSLRNKLGESGLAGEYGERVYGFDLRGFTYGIDAAGEGKMEPAIAQFAAQKYIKPLRDLAIKTGVPVGKAAGSQYLFFAEQAI